MKLTANLVRLMFGFLVAINLLLFVGASFGAAVLESNRRKVAKSDSAEARAVKLGAVQACSGVALFGLANLIFSVPLTLHFWKQPQASLKP